jgi:hypothetical protein
MWVVKLLDTIGCYTSFMLAVGAVMVIIVSSIALLLKYFFQPERRSRKVSPAPCIACNRASSLIMEGSGTLVVVVLLCALMQMWRKGLSFHACPAAADGQTIDLPDWKPSYSTYQLTYNGSGLPLPSTDVTLISWTLPNSSAEGRVINAPVAVVHNGFMVRCKAHAHASSSDPLS